MSWTLKVRDRFSAAHFLKGYQGKCEKIHGHTFQVEVEVRVCELDAVGIGIDFAAVKKTLALVLPDHVLLNDVFPFKFQFTEHTDSLASSSVFLLLHVKDQTRDRIHQGSLSRTV